jgi:single-strand DNA-binding protein
MMSITVAGILGGDAVTKEAGKGTITEFSIAHNDKDPKTGEKTVTWVKCTLWNERGEKLAPYLKQGGRVTAVGALRVREYEDRQGLARVSIECRVDSLELMGDGGKAQDQAPAQRQASRPGPSSPAREKPQATGRF